MAGSHCALKQSARMLALAGVFLIQALASGWAAEKPGVPPGRDPGGVAIAIVGPGVDYTVPEIAVRLARDGEGEIVGFDLIDGDRRPYAALPVPPDVAARVTFIVLRQAVASRLVVFRVDSAVQASIARALAMTAMSPARIVLLDVPAAATLRWEGLVAVSQRLADRLVVVAVEGAIGRSAEAAGEAGLANVLLVRGCVRAGAECVAAGEDLASVDVVVPVDAGAGEGSGDAAAQVAALAVRVLGAEPQMDGAALKGRIVGLGAVVPERRYRLIEDPAQVVIAPKVTGNVGR